MGQVIVGENGCWNDRNCVGFGVKIYSL